MANSGPAQNATVEEILASIRQAISEDDSKRTGERVRGDGRASTVKRPVASVSEVFPEQEASIEDEHEEADALADSPSNVLSVDQDVIELAIEQALDGVRAELEGTRAAPQRPRVRQLDERAPPQRAIPRPPRIAPPLRREIPAPPRRALLSPRADAEVTASFDDLAKAMIEGNSRKLDEVVEDLLRPMLKGWLENNLPQMVERLVREEIERVARGGRR